MLFGGKILVEMDMVVFILVFRYLRKECVIVFMDWVDFLYFVCFLDCVSYEFFVIWMGRILMEVFVKVVVEDLILGEKCIVVMLFVIFVVFSKENNLVLVLCVIFEIEEEKELYCIVVLCVE